MNCRCGSCLAAGARTGHADNDVEAVRVEALANAEVLFVATGPLLYKGKPEISL